MNTLTRRLYRISLYIFAVATAFGLNGCGNTTTPSTGLTGWYALLAVDGAFLPASDGAGGQITGGLITILPKDTVRVDVMRQGPVAGGGIGPNIIERGFYCGSRKGQTLTLTPIAATEPLTGTLTTNADGHVTTITIRQSINGTTHDLAYQEPR